MRCGLKVDAVIKCKQEMIVEVEKWGVQGTEVYGRGSNSELKNLKRNTRISEFQHFSRVAGSKNEVA